MAEYNPIVYWGIVVAIVATIVYMFYVAFHPNISLLGPVDADSCEHGCVVLGRCGTEDECKEGYKLKVFFWVIGGFALFLAIICISSMINKRRNNQKLAD